MSYGTATYGGTTLGSSAVVDNNIIDRNTTREIVLTIRVPKRELEL